MLANQIQSCIKYTMTKSHCFRNAWLATSKNQIIKAEESYDSSQELHNKHTVKSQITSIHNERSDFLWKLLSKNKRELPNPTEDIQLKKSNALHPGWNLESFPCRSEHYRDAYLTASVWCALKLKPKQNSKNSNKQAQEDWKEARALTFTNDTICIQE